jgi:peptidyl-prolyl cis-trans isomerase A (cyclophilin A)
VLSTDLGDIIVEVDIDRAPITAQNFLAYVDGQLLDNTTCYRIVTLDNQPETDVKIEVVQWGLPFVDRTYPTPLPAIAHETTEQTGLRHTAGALSMGRFAPGTASSGFVICVTDQPELDFAGKRNPDGQGFAAFGRVVSGMDVVRAIHATGKPGTFEDQMVADPVVIKTVRRA